MRHRNRSAIDCIWAVPHLPAPPGPLGAMTATGGFFHGARRVTGPKLSKTQHKELAATIRWHGAVMTPKQELFVREYLIDLNATQAAIRAGYSAKHANDQAAQLLARDDIRAAVDAAKVGRSERTEITSERVLREIAGMAFYDPAEIMLEIGSDDPDLANDVSIDDDGKIYGLRGPRDIKRLPEDVRRAIVGWSYDKNQNFTIKLADKSKALDQLARHLSLYNDKLAIGSMDGLAERLARVSRVAEPVLPTVPAAVAAPAEPPPGPAPAEPEPEAAADLAPLPPPPPPPPAAAAGDWAAATYQPLIPWPEKPAFVDVEYEAMTDGLIGSRNR